MKYLLQLGVLVLTITSLLSAPAEANGCTNKGAGAVVPATVTEGPAICGADLELEITLPGGGGTVTVGASSCPSYVEIVPAYNPAVIKPGYNIADTQKVFHQRATYKCVSCGFLWLSECCEMASKWADTKNYKLTYQDAPCDIVIPQAHDAQQTEQSSTSEEGQDTSDKGKGN